MGLIDPLHDHPQPRRLFGEIASELPMRLLADLLVADRAQGDAGLDVAHISHCDAAHPFLRTEVHHRA